LTLRTGALATGRYATPPIEPPNPNAAVQHDSITSARRIRDTIFVAASNTQANGTDTAAAWINLGEVCVFV
jgi:hypothetical protein